MANIDQARSLLTSYLALVEPGGSVRIYLRGGQVLSAARAPGRDEPDEWFNFVDDHGAYASVRLDDVIALQQVKLQRD